MVLSIEFRIKKRILKRGRGWCFTLIHFLDLGSHASVRKALSNLQHQKKIRRITKGIYDYPKKDELVGEVPPNLDAVAQVIAEKNGVRIQPSGAHAANLAGFSTQVPGKVIFLTEGRSRKIKIGNREIIFKNTTGKVMFSAGTKEGLLIQALQNLGEKHIDEIARARIASFLKGSQEKKLRKNLQYAPVWIQTLIFDIMRFQS